MHIRKIPPQAIRDRNLKKFDNEKFLFFNLKYPEIFFHICLEGINTHAHTEEKNHTWK